MLIFANQQYLFLLLLVPLMPLLYALVRWLRKRRLSRIGDPALVKQLIPSWSGAKGWVRLVLFDLAFAFFVVGLARPQIGAKLQERETRGAEIMICLDVSNSMLARDYSPNRLERAKLAISRITDKLQEDRIGSSSLREVPSCSCPSPTTTSRPRCSFRASIPNPCQCRELP